MLRKIRETSRAAPTLRNTQQAKGALQTLHSRHSKSLSLQSFSQSGRGRKTCVFFAGCVFSREGKTATTTIIFQKSFASDATPKRHLMAHQMRNLCGFSVFHCAEGAIGASFRGTPKMKNGAPQDELQDGRGGGWVVPYFCRVRVFSRQKMESLIVHLFPLYLFLVRLFFPKGPFRTKSTTTIAKILDYYAVVFLLRPPDLLRRGEGKCL